MQFFDIVGCDHVWHIGRIKGRGDLRIQINPIHHNQHGRIAKRFHLAEFLRRKQHEQGFA